MSVFENNPKCIFQPFYNNIYYPYTRETQGTHSSAGIPSLLNSPLSQPYTSGPPPPAMSASSSTTIPPFKFRQRRESVDWRRVSAVDVDLVASELDFLTLQEHVQGVTFCSVEGERCPRCQSPVDPALLKLFRLAQLTVEYLLHSQEVLTLSLQAAEERLRAAGLDRDHVLAQQQKQAEEITSLKAELRHRKKILKSHQNVLASRLTNCHKVLNGPPSPGCHLCFISAGTPPPRLLKAPLPLWHCSPGWIQSSCSLHLSG